MEMQKVRLQKLLADAGIASRRKCEELIASGRVAINATTATLGDKADPEFDVVTVDGEVVPTSSDKVYLLLSKPREVVTTVEDTHSRRTVLDLIPDELRARFRLYPVGRLDKDSEGLLIITNDGDFAHRLTHPSSKVPKTYVVTVSGPLCPGALSKLSRGVELEDGRTRPAKVRQIERVGDRRILKITLTEGRKRQVRRMVRAVGGEVHDLVRTSIGPVTDRGLRPGEWRYLRSTEVHELLKVVRKGRGVGEAAS